MAAHAPYLGRAGSGSRGTSGTTVTITLTTSCYPGEMLVISAGAQGSAATDLSSVVPSKGLPGTRRSGGVRSSLYGRWIATVNVIDQINAGDTIVLTFSTAVTPAVAVADRWRGVRLVAAAEASASDANTVAGATHTYDLANTASESLLLGALYMAGPESAHVFTPAAGTTKLETFEASGASIVPFYARASSATTTTTGGTVANPGPNTSAGSVALTVEVPSYVPTQYYVDPVAGSDFNDGLSPGTAWQSPAKPINTAALSGVVNLASGDYGVQAHTGIAQGRRQFPLVLKPAPGAVVKWGQTSFKGALVTSYRRPNRVWLAGLQIQGGVLWQGATADLGLISCDISNSGVGVRWVKGAQDGNFAAGITLHDIVPTANDNGDGTVSISSDPSLQGYCFKLDGSVFETFREFGVYNARIAGCRTINFNYLDFINMGSVRSLLSWRNRAEVWRSFSTLWPNIDVEPHEDAFQIEGGCDRIRSIENIYNRAHQINISGGINGTILVANCLLHDGQNPGINGNWPQYLFVYCNTMFNNQTALTDFRQASGQTPTLQQAVFWNNLLRNTTGQTPSGQTKIDHNVWESMQTTQGHYIGPNDVEGTTVAFVDEPKDYRLAAGSVALGKANFDGLPYALELPKRDIRGVLRPTSGAGDAGCYQRDPSIDP